VLKAQTDALATVLASNPVLLEASKIAGEKAAQA